MAGQKATRKQLGAWSTPAVLIEEMIGWLRREIADDGTPLRVVDPACGDGRLLVAVRDAFPRRSVHLVGCDVSAPAVAAAAAHGIEAIHADALTLGVGSDAPGGWTPGSFDVVIGNPPFLSQMAAATTRGGSSQHGGGPYADAAAEFTALASRLVRPRGGHIVLVLPQSILGARDAASVRDEVDRRAELVWSWWHRNQQLFDASVNVCALGWRSPGGRNSVPWTSIVTTRLDVPQVPDTLESDGSLGDRNRLNANFRDEYYALVPAVSDDAEGPPLVTSGLIDPGVCWWSQRTVRFAKQRFERPRVDLDLLEGRFRSWADKKLVPKVLVANQTRIIEAVCDPDGDWLPGVPVTSIWSEHGDRTQRTDRAWETAAVLTSPIASALMWQLGGGTGLSTSAVRIGPSSLAQVPWPGGTLVAAVKSLRAGDVVGCARHVLGAYGIDIESATALLQWWEALLPKSTASTAIRRT